MEEKIVYERGGFYAYAIRGGKYEIRKNGHVHATALGVAPSVERAVRFIDRAALYPHNF